MRLLLDVEEAFKLARRLTELGVSVMQDVTQHPATEVRPCEMLIFSPSTGETPQGPMR